MTMCVWSLACRQSVFYRYHSEKHLPELPTRWRRKPAGTEITSLSPYVYISKCSVAWFWCGCSVVVLSVWCAWSSDEGWHLGTTTTQPAGRIFRELKFARCGHSFMVKITMIRDVKRGHTIAVKVEAISWLSELGLISIEFNLLQ